MFRNLFFVVSCSVALVSGNRQDTDVKKGIEKVTVEQTVGKPWPLPQVYTSTQTAMEIDPIHFRFSATGQTCDILEHAFSRYTQIIFGKKDSTLRFSPGRRPNGKRSPLHLALAEVLGGLDVAVDTACDSNDYQLSLESDESYSLYIGNGQASLNAKEVWGALRGLETFSQIIWMKGSEYFVNSTKITDFPRFKHRGILLDTSRHFLSVHAIMENIEIMAQNKFNVFHWHVVDDPSFPFESHTFPELSAKGAYPPANAHTYTQQDVKDIQEYARFRGVRVMPEFDTPGHSLSWGKGQPGLLTECYTKGKPNGKFGPIDPSLNTAWRFINAFFSEVASLYKDNYIHLGGDEVPFDCWKSNPNITAFMEKEHIKNYYKLEAYYIKKLANIVDGLKKNHFVWQEVFDNNPDIGTGSIIHVWKQSGYEDEMAKVTKADYKAILSGCWYLDYISLGPDWEKYYTCDPQDFHGTDIQKKLVIGGEACLWGEWVDDTNVVSRLWPRASAIAERLWSSEKVSDVNAAAGRLEEHRCRLIRRGFAAEPINGPSYCSKEFR